MTEIRVNVARLENGAGLDLSAYESDGAAGMDLRAAVDDGSPSVIEPGARALIPTGIAIALPAGYEAQVRPRSGLAARHGVTVLNSPGTIDADYRGEIKVILINHGPETFTVKRGDRIAQIVFATVTRASLVETSDLDSTTRSTGGFGSSGNQ